MDTKIAYRAAPRTGGTSRDPASPELLRDTWYSGAETKKAALVTIALFAVACDSMEPVVELTEREAIGMLRTLTGVLEDADVYGEGDMDVVSCPIGGASTVEVISFIEPEGDTIWYDDMVSIKPSACEMSLTGNTFTVDGAPDVRLHVEGWVVDFDDFTLEWRLFGAFTWKRGSEGGARCEVSLESQDVTVDSGGSIGGTFRGALCGFDVVIDWDELIP